MDVRRPSDKRLDPKYANKTMKFDGGSITVWDCFSGHGMGPIHIVKDSLIRIGYKSIPNDTMFPFAEENTPLVWRFQHYNDPKNTS